MPMLKVHLPGLHRWTVLVPFTAWYVADSRGRWLGLSLNLSLSVKESIVPVAGNAGCDEFIERKAPWIIGIAPALDGQLYTSMGLDNCPGPTLYLFLAIIPANKRTSEVNPKINNSSYLP